MKKRIVIALTMVMLTAAAAGCGQAGDQTAGIPINQQTTSGGQNQADVQDTAEQSGSEADGAGSQTAQNQTTQNQTAQDQTTQNQTTQNQTTQRQTGTQQTTAGITEDQAKETALTHAGITEEETAGIRVKQDREDGRLVFDVEFYVGANEYDYEIAADTGEILKSDFNIEEDFINQGQTGGQNQTVLSADEAKKLIVEKVPGVDSTNIRIKLDMDDGRQIYEGEFFYNNKEYEFEMDAVTGTFLEWSEENF